MAYRTTGKKLKGEIIMSILEVTKMGVGHREPAVLYGGKIGDQWQRGPGKAGDVSVTCRMFNAGTKTIKYITFFLVPYNQVGDVVACTASGVTEVSVKVTGPLEPEEDGKVEWEDLWFNETITEVKLKEVLIQYMDNSEETIPGDAIKNMIDDDSEYMRVWRKKREMEEAEKRAKMTPQELAREERERKKKEAADKQYEAGEKAAAWIKKIFKIK